MTNKEAIKRIEDHMRAHRIGEYPHVYLAEALTMAMTALGEQDTILTDGVYIETFAVKDNKRYKGRIINMRDVSIILTDSLMNGVEKLISV